MWSTATDNGAEGDISAILLSGLSNVYTDYITTFEEYQQQRYEGASTIYGPHTQRAHQQQYASLFDSLLKVNIGLIVARLRKAWSIYSTGQNSSVLT